MKRIIEMLGLDEGATEDQCIEKINSIRRSADSSGKNARISGEARALRRIANRAGISVPDDLDANEDSRSELVVEIGKRLGAKQDAKARDGKDGKDGKDGGGNGSGGDGDAEAQAKAKADAQRKATVNFMVGQKLRAGKVCHDTAVDEVLRRLDSAKLTVKEAEGIVTDVDIPDEAIADVKKSAPHCFPASSDDRIPDEGAKGDGGKDASVEAAAKYAAKVKV